MTAEIIRLSELTPGQSGDTYALLASKEEARTRDDKPYFRVTFKDAHRSAVAMIWSDHGLFEDCSATWTEGDFYKLRCRYDENNYGSQIEIDRIRPVVEGDRDNGFDPVDFFTATRFDRVEMFDELCGLARQHITDEPLQQLVLSILDENADGIRQHSAAARNHHAFFGGYLEHTLSVVRTAVFLADKYFDYYRQMQPPMSKSLVIAGAILHDIGKLHELEFKPSGWEYTAKGRLVGHILIGRDMVRDKAAEIPEFDEETLLRLEHIIIAHQNLPEWGSPIAPHTPEALLVHFADDIDAKFHELAIQLEADWPDDAEFTSHRNPLRRRIFRGLKSDSEETH